MTDERIISEAKEAAKNAREFSHAPHSKFRVGAALIAEDGTIWPGCNVEASSYGLTICAERTALVSAIAQGRKKFTHIIVATDTETPTSPCGMCRQMVYDFAPDAEVIMINLRGDEKRFPLKSLLPEAFTEDQIG